MPNEKQHLNKVRIPISFYSFWTILVRKKAPVANLNVNRNVQYKNFHNFLQSSMQQMRPRPISNATEQKFAGIQYELRQNKPTLLFTMELHQYSFCRAFVELTTDGQQL